KPPGNETPGPRSSRNPADNVASAGSHAPAQTGSVSPQQRQTAREAHASLAPASSGAFPAPVAAPPAPAAGPFAVQVTSQRSEADAQASFKSLQQQFPSVLGNRSPVIRRANLGDRGTYYRAQIPFSSQSAASEFCA